MNPFREAVFAAVDPELHAELQKAEAEFQKALEEALAASGRAVAWLRQRPLDRPFEVLEFELEKEHGELVQYHRAKFVKKLKWILEAWKDRE